MTNKSVFDLFGTSPKLENEGVVLDFGGPRFRVLRANPANRKYKSVFNAKTRPYAQALQRGALSEEKSDEILMDVFFETVVLGWENVTNQAGEPLDFNRANFMWLMKQLPDLWTAIRQESSNIENFQEANPEEDGETLGN